MSKKKQLLPKDLINDLVREENVKERIVEQMKKPIDQPRQFNPAFPGFASSSRYWGAPESY